MKKMSVVLFSLFTFVMTAFAGPYDAWSKYRTVTINTTADDGGANILSAQTDFPVLVRLSDADAASGADVLAEALAGGADIRFADEAGEVALPYEIEHWSATSAAIWVRVPSVAGDWKNEIRLYWGVENITSQSNGPAVFDTANGFRAVWHLNETASPARDATVLGTDAVWMNAPTSAPGNIGNAINIQNPSGTSGGNGKYLRAAYNTANNNFKTNATDGLTLSAWVNRTTDNGEANQGIAGRWNWNGGDRRQSIIQANPSAWRFAVSPTGTNAEFTEGDAPVVNGDWVHVLATYRSGEQILYVNGVASTTLDHAIPGLDSAWAAAPFLIGRMETNGCCLQGIDARIDEVRLSNTTRSSDWVRLEYETQKSGATAVTLGESQVQASTFAYATLTSVYLAGNKISSNVPTVNGSVLGITVNPALPAGLTLDPMTGAISGTPTVATVEGVYTVTAEFSEPNETVVAELTITVNPRAPADLEYLVTNAMYGIDTEIDENIPTVNSLTDPNQMVTNFSITPALPAGLTIDAVTGVISGTPTEASSAKTYTVTASNVTGSTTAQLTIAVTPPPSALTYKANPVVYTGGVAAPIVPNTPSVTGLVTSWSIAPALPAGMKFDTATGAITGAPMAGATGPFTVSATNVAGTATVDLDLTVTAPENYGSWTGMSEFAINTAAVGATTQQTGYPLLVRLGAAHAGIFAGANEDGSDIRFSKAGGTRLAYEMESWDKAGTMAAFWVLVDTLPASETVALRIHYGNTEASSISSGSRIFNTASGFQAVWHMNAGTGNEVDVTANGFVASQNGAPTEAASGVIGAARGFNGSNQWFQVNGSANSVLSFPVNGNYSMSAWAYFTPGSNDDNRTILGKHDQEYGLSLSGNGAANWQFFQYSNGGWATITAPKTNGVWQQVTAVKEGANTYLYVNGVRTTGPVTNPNPAGRNLGTDLNIGRRADNNSRHWRGNLDEVRMANVALSADWVKLDYETQMAAAVPLSGLAYTSNTYTFTDNGEAITPVPAPTFQTGSATNFSISPALPPDLSLNATTGEITGTPKQHMPATQFVVTARRGAWVASQTLTLEILPTPPGNIVYATNPVTYEAGLVVAGNAPTNTGTITSWSISPALPAGLHFNTLTGVISGEPLVTAAAADYEVIGTGPEGSDTVAVTITVLAPSEDFSTWSHNQSITLNTSATGSDVASTVTNFPLLVRLGHAEATIFSQALSDGADIRFAKANGITRLPYELVSWDKEAEKAEIWVKVDTVYGNNSTQSIKMFWGKSGVADSSDGSRVFAASNGYVTAFHMGNPVGDSAAGVRPNSVSPGTNDAKPAFIGSHPNVLTQGIIGMADTLRGQGGAANGDHFNFGSLVATNYPNGLTLSMWAKPTSYVGDFVQFYTIGNISNGAGVAAQTVWLGKRAGGNDLSAEVAGSNRIDAPGGQGTAALNQWQYYSYSVLPGGAGARLYRNGVQVAQTNNTQTLANVARTSNFIGRANWGDNTFNGVVDEVRFSNTARSADFVKLEYQSQNRYQALANIGLQAPTVVYTPDSLTYLQNATITAVSPAAASGPVTNWAITPALPSGLTLNATTGVITGAPLAVHASTKHTITATNDGGSTSDSIVITVNPGPPADLSYAATPVTYYTGVAIDTNFATVTGEVDSFTVTPALPDGLLLDESTGAITGSPATVTAQTVYTVTAHNATGTTTADVDITVLIPVPAAPVIASPADNALAVPVPFTILWNTVTGTVDSYQLQGSESGFATVDMDTVITDTSFFIHEAPYASLLSARVRAINSTGPGEWSSVVSFTTIDAPPAISYATTPVIYTVGLEVTPNAPDITESGPITGYTIDPDLTAATGLAFNTTTGIITGTPTQDAVPTNYTVVASGPGGKDTVIVNIGTSSELPPMIAYATDTLVFVKDAAITSLTVSIDSELGGPIDSFTVVPAFPAGLSLNDSTGEITGTPTVVVATASYVVTAHGLGGVGKDTLVITVNDIAPVIAYAVDTVTYAVGTAISPLTPSSTGGAVVSWSITPDLAALTGLTFNTSTGELSGTPVNEEPAGNYTIVATNSGGTDTAVIHVTVQGAPLVTKAPADTSVVAGGAASFNVAATASGTLSYQWRKGTTNLVNGTGISGATSDTLKLSGVALADTGSYNVVVTSTLNGTVTSTTSTDGVLKINTAPVIATQPHDTTVVSGSNASFKVTVAAGPGSSAGTLSYQWRKGTTNLTNGGKISGATSATLTITGAALADTASTYNVVVTRTLNGTTMNATSNNATLRVNVAPVISGQPAGRTVVAGASAGFKVTATVAGGGTLSYQWRKGTTNLTNGANVAGATSDTLTLSGAALADTGSYNVVVTSTLNGATAASTSNNATLSVNAAPVISGQPAARTVVAGTSAGFKVVAPAGAGSSAGTLSYQWRKGTTNLVNGANVSGATSDSLTLMNVAVSDTSANYNVVVTRTLNGTTTNVTSNNTALRVNAAPVISGQPAARTVVAGASAGFKVAATVAGGGTLSYQWRKGTTNLVNGANVSGATSDTLTLSGTALADTASNYNVVVTSTLNGVTTTTTSGNATLLVNAAPVITTQPVATAHIVTGTNLTLTVAVAGGPGSSAGTLSYQWRKGSTNLANTGNVSGATSANLVIATPTAADTGTYSVVVTRTLNGTTTTVTSTNSSVQLPVSILPGSFVFRVSGELRQYTFQLPAGAVTTEKVTMSINDVSGRNVWTYSIYPSRDPKARDIVWNGATSTGRPAAAGMYIVKLSVRNSDQTTTRYIQKAVSLKPSR